MSSLADKKDLVKTMASRIASKAKGAVSSMPDKMAKFGEKVAEVVKPTVPGASTVKAIRGIKVGPIERMGPRPAKSMPDRVLNKKKLLKKVLKPLQ